MVGFATPFSLPCPFLMTSYLDAAILEIARATPNIRPHVRPALAVEPQDVVLGQAESADRCLRLQATVWAMPVVAMQPVRQLGGALIGMQIGAGICPFA